MLLDQDLATWQEGELWQVHWSSGGSSDSGDTTWQLVQSMDIIDSVYCVDIMGTENTEELVEVDLREGGE